MSEVRQNLMLGERKGMPFYAANPSIPDRGALQVRSRPKKIASGRDAMIVHPSTSEVLGRASVAFMVAEDVDPQRFIKLYVEGVSRITGLKAAGVRVLELVIVQLHDKAGQDQVLMSAFVAKQAGIEERTYQRGLRDLQEREILFASHAEGVFYINIQYMFNGNRLHFITSYYRRSATSSAVGQGELPLDDPC